MLRTIRTRRWTSLLAIAMVAIGTAAAVAEFRYCSTPSTFGYNPQTTPQGCWRAELHVGNWSRVPQTDPSTYPGNSGKLMVRCDDQRWSDGCHDDSYSWGMMMTPTCNRVQNACGTAQVYLRVGAEWWSGNMFNYSYNYKPLPPESDGYQYAWNAGYSASSTFNCNNVYWLQAQGGSAMGVNCSTNTPGDY